MTTGQRLDLYHHFAVDPDPRIDQILALLQQLTVNGVKTMATLADITAAVTAEKTVEDSVIALLGKIEAELSAAIASNDPAAMQAVVDLVHSNTAALSAAVAAAEPPAPVVAPDPVPVVVPPPAPATTP